MKATINGEVVDTDKNEWAFNGRSGTSYTVHVRSEGSSPAQAAERVKVSADQYGAFSAGEKVELPVDIFANTVERGGVITGAKISCSLAADYKHTRAAHGPQAVKAS